MGLNFPRIPVLTLAAAVLVAGAAFAGSNSLATAADVALVAKAAAIGPKIGTKLPAGLTVIDNAGRKVVLSGLKGRKGSLIVLVRSAAWCPYCKAQLKDLKDVAAAARARGVTLIGVSYDGPEVLAKFAKAEALNFGLYSDTGSMVIDRLRLRDPTYDKASFAYGVPHPTVLRIGADGRVKAKAVELDYKLRPSKNDILAMVALN